MNYLSFLVMSKNSIRRQLIIIIAITLAIGLGAMTFFSIKFYIDNMEKSEEESITLLSSTLLEVIKNDMINGNGKNITYWLDNIKRKGRLKEVKMFRNNGAEAFLDNKTINSVNRFLEDQTFTLRPDSEVKEVKASIKIGRLKTIISGEHVSYNEDIEGEPVHTMLFPIFKEESCSGCHGYDNNPVRGALQISVSRVALLKSVKSFATRSVATILFVIITIALIMSWLINNKIIKPITEAIYKISSSAAEQDQITSEQASSINEITTTVEELNTSSKQVYEKADSLAKQAKETLTVAFEGQKAIENSVSEMNLIKNRVEVIAEEVLALSENTNQIGAIINVVEDIANKTDMLALNAAIEAAKAGEQGKGFAVVASEVRSLADQSKKATDRVSTLIQDIQKAVNSTVMATEDGANKVDIGVNHILEAGATINNAIKTFKTTTEAANEITIAARQESLANEQVASAMHHVNLGMKESSDATKNSLQTITKLYRLVDRRQFQRTEEE